MLCAKRLSNPHTMIIKKKVNARYLKRNVTSERNSQECNGIKAFTGICKYVQNTRVVHKFVECATWEQQQGNSRRVHALE